MIIKHAVTAKASFQLGHIFLFEAMPDCAALGGTEDKNGSSPPVAPSKKLKQNNPFGKSTVSGTVSSPSDWLPDADLGVHSVE
jgi:hypothetical protein